LKRQKEQARLARAAEKREAYRARRNAKANRAEAADMDAPEDGIEPLDDAETLPPEDDPRA
jgi:hypothetical protein